MQCIISPRAYVVIAINIASDIVILISVRSVIRSTAVASYVADINTLLASYSAREHNKVITMLSVQWQMPIMP